DDRVWTAVEGDRLPDDRPIAAEARSPDGVAQNDDVRVPWFVLLRSKRAAERRPDAEHGEEICRHRRGVERIRLALSSEIQAVVPVDGHVLEDIVLIAPIE